MRIATIIFAAALALSVSAPARAQVQIAAKTAQLQLQGGVPAVVLDAFRTSLENGLELPEGSSSLLSLPDLHIKAMNSPNLRGKALSALSPENQVKMAVIVQRTKHLESVPETRRAVAENHLRSPPGTAPRKSAKAAESRSQDAREVLAAIDKALSGVSLDELKDEAAVEAAMGKIFDGLLARARANAVASDAAQGTLVKGRSKTGLKPRPAGDSSAEKTKKTVPAPGEGKAKKKPRPLPLITFGLIAINILVHSLSSMDLLDTLGWGLVPYTYQYYFDHGGLTALAGQSWTLVSSMFVHGNWEHLAHNMIGLGLVGTIVERGLGHWKTLGAYLGAGLFAGIVWTLANWGAAFGSVGASGAVMGLAGVFMGLFWFYYRKKKVKTIRQSLGIFLLGWLASILALQFAFDLWDTLFEIGDMLGLPWGKADQVNNLAHVAGFLWGLLSLRWWMRRARA